MAKYSGNFSLIPRRTLWNTAYLMFFLTMLLQPLAAQTPPSYSYQILYTGRTLGYARIPDEQTLALDTPSGTTAKEVAKAFLDRFDTDVRDPKTAILPAYRITEEFLDQFDLASKNPLTAGVPKFRIAMGDNFSPELYGRSIRVDSSIPVPACDGTPNSFYPSTIHLPKDYFTYDKSGWQIWCSKKVLRKALFFDNVANFLIRAGYDTVVPGKHDFYFGPQYLRQVADYLGKNGVRMLGENIIVASSLAPTPMNAHPRIPERLAQPCHWNTGKGHDCYHTDFGPASLDLPDNVVPWKRQFVLKGARRVYKNKDKTLARDDELNYLKDSDVDYHPIFKPNSVEICAEPGLGTATTPGPVTAGDPAKVLVSGNHCFPLKASDEICDASAQGRLKSTCEAIYPPDGIYKKAEQAASTNITFLFANPDDHLWAGRNHMFCVNPIDDPSPPTCQPFPVQVPLLWQNSDELDQPATGMAACDPNASIPCPYALVARDGLKVAIFAVVDPDLLSNVGMLNTGWLNTKDKRWDTVVQITAPDYALLQTLDLCNATEDCRKAPKILMAQMSYARATQLISNSKFSKVFDVVVTHASPEHDTEGVDNTYQGDKPRFVLTPPESVSPDPVTDDLTQPANLAKIRTMSFFTPQVYVATIHKEKPPDAAPTAVQAVALPARRPTCQASLPSPPPPPPPTPPPPKITALPIKPETHDFGSCWSLSNISARWAISTLPQTNAPQKDLVKYPARVPKPLCLDDQAGCSNLQRLAKKYLDKYRVDKNAQADPVTNPAASDPLSQAVLWAMRNALKTDAAIIQSRDLYDADNLSLEEIKLKETQDQISRVIWKGDVAIVLHVTGATIRKLLKQSVAFAQLDKNSLSTEIEKGRDLVTLGIYPDPKDSDTYYINGAVMSDTALYTIAATDFISGGDTGYSNLVPPDVLPAFRLGDFAHNQYQPIAGLVCKELATSSKQSIPCADMRLGPEYFDPASQSPADATPGFTTSQTYRAFGRNFLMPRRPFLYSEEAVQQRPFLSLKLENLDFGASGVFISHFRDTSNKLPGISNPLITGNAAKSIGADHKARLIYDYHWGTEYLLSDSSFLDNDTWGPPDFTHKVALAYNVLGSEVGGTVRLRVPRDRTGLNPGTPKPPERPSWLSFQYSLRFERELTGPVDTNVAITPTPPANQVSNIALHTPTASTIYGRGGLRIESGDNYFEFGIEQIDSRSVLQSYALPQTNGPTNYCFPRVTLGNLLCGPDFPFDSTTDTKNINNLALIGNPTLTVSPQTGSYLTPGLYWNLYWKFPIWSRRDANRADQSWYFTLTNKGDFYGNTRSDTDVQTRYLYKLTPGLSLPIWAGLSLTPKVDFVLYENKIDRFHYRTAQPSITLSYTFNWREGMSWTRALRYGAQTTTPSPAGTTH